MNEHDEHTNVEQMDIVAENITVNTGWTTKMALWNTIGTVVGALSGLASLLVASVALWIALSR